jgi:acetoin utilization protein AcuB
MHVVSKSEPRAKVSSKARIVRVDQYMTEAPHSIGSDQPLALAHEMMRTHRIRHLPVLRAGKLVGVVSQRDLYFLETMREVDPAHVKVEEAMAQEAYAVATSAPLARVAKTMAANKYGCAVVMEDGEVVGIFTAVDGLRALATVLTSPQA